MQYKSTWSYRNICLRFSIMWLCASSCYSCFYVGSMYDAIRLHVARSYTSFPDNPFYWRHPSLIQPSSIRPSSLPSHLCVHFCFALFPTQCSSLQLTCRTTSVSFPGLSFLCAFTHFHRAPCSFISDISLNKCIIKTNRTLTYTKLYNVLISSGQGLSGLPA